MNRRVDGDRHRDRAPASGSQRRFSEVLRRRPYADAGLIDDIAVDDRHRRNHVHVGAGAAHGAPASGSALVADNPAVEVWPLALAIACTWCWYATVLNSGPSSSCRSPWSSRTVGRAVPCAASLSADRRDRPCDCGTLPALRPHDELLADDVRIRDRRQSPRVAPSCSSTCRSTSGPAGRHLYANPVLTVDGDTAHEASQVE